MEDIDRSCNRERYRDQEIVTDASELDDECDRRERHLHGRCQECRAADDCERSQRYTRPDMIPEANGNARMETKRESNTKVVQMVLRPA